MVTCPHCLQAGISTGSRSTFGVFRPSRCGVCGRLSTVSRRTQLVNSFCSALLAYLGLGASIWLWSWWPLIVGLLMSVATHWAITVWSLPVPLAEKDSNS